MKTFTDRIILMACLAAASSVMAAPLSDRELAYLAKKQEIVFVSQPDHAPFEFVRKKHVSGMNVELAQWIATDMGFKVRFETAPLAEAMKMVNSGEADALSSLFYSETLDADFDFSDCIKKTPVTLYVQTDRSDIENLFDLEGLKVAITGSGKALGILQQHGIRCEVKFVSSTAEGVDLVINGTMDAMIGNELITQHHLYSSEKGTLKTIGDPLFTTQLGMAVREGNQELLNLLNKGISHAQKSGTLNKIQVKWLGSEYAQKARPSRTLFLLALLATAAAITVTTTIGLILLWNRKLQRKIDEQTRQYAKSEERLRQIFENSPDAVFVLDWEGRVLSANSRACESVKMKKQELLSKNLHDLIPESFRGEVDGYMNKWFSGKLKRCEGVSKASNGVICPIEMTGALQNIEGKQVLQLHVRDISLRKEAEQKIEVARQMEEDSKEMAVQSRKIAEHASQAKSEFLANMSHEIRTPLNDIVGMAQLITDTELNSEQSNCIETIQQSTTSLLNIINHVLDISKIEVGQMDVHESTIDLREMCDTLFHMFEQQAKQSGIALTSECQDNVPLYVLGDKGLIEQMLVNLLGNALKFTHHGSVTLNIECHQKSSAGVELYFQVIDTGIGIDKEKQKTIFEKFTQADGSTKRIHGGTGLGLAICKQLIELMGGKVGLISSTGQGSTFFFNLTLQQTAHPTSVKKPERVKAKHVIKPDVRILLVEDNRVNQKVAVAILHKAGCQVDAVDNGIEAIQRIRQESYDVVLMDCQMPIMDGFEATARIRAMPPPLNKTPIIAITAHAMKDDKQKCLDEGMDDYIAKPINRQALIDLINQYTAES